MLYFIVSYFYLTHPSERDGIFDAHQMNVIYASNFIIYSIPFFLFGMLSIMFTKSRAEYSIISVSAGGASIWLFYSLMIMIPKHPSKEQYDFIFRVLSMPLLIGIAIILLITMTMFYKWNEITKYEKSILILCSLLSIPAIYRWIIWSVEYISYMDPAKT